MRTRLFCDCVVAFLVGLPFAAEGQQTKLRVTLQLPATDALLGKSLVRFKEDVEKRSNGAVSIEIFDKGKLYIDDQTVGAVATGAIEMGVAGLNQFAKRIPAIDIMEQPFLFNFRGAGARDRQPRQRDAQADRQDDSRHGWRSRSVVAVGGEPDFHFQGYDDDGA